MDQMRNKRRISIARWQVWMAAISVVVLVGLILGILSRAPDGNPIRQALNPSNATTATTTATTTLLSAGEIIARSRSAIYQDMTGKEIVLYGDGGKTTATISLTLNPTRSEEVDSQFAAAGQLIEVDDVIKDGSMQYQHTISYRTNPPTDTGWKLDRQPVPDPRPLNVLLLAPFTSAAILIGTEAMNGVNVYHLQVQRGATSKQEVWIRTDNFYFVQWKATDSFSQALITMTAWDTGRSISVPSI